MRSNQHQDMKTQFQLPAQGEEKPHPAVAAYAEDQAETCSHDFPGKVSGATTLAIPSRACVNEKRADIRWLDIRRAHAVSTPRIQALFPYALLRFLCVRETLKIPG